MAKKKRKPERGRPRRNKAGGSAPPHMIDLDRRAMEGSMYELVRSMHPEAEDTPLSRAQVLMYQAFREDRPQRRTQLARETLAISPDCADAYLLLGEYAESRKEVLGLYEQAIAAGERALGPEAFQRDVGRFWGIIETEAAMRARLELALALWPEGRRDEAVQHLRELLRLNPNDNQGVRYTLAGFLLFLDRDDELAQLLDKYDDVTACWAYTRALLAFRKSGDTLEARQMLKVAKKANKHVPDYLLGRKYPADVPPGPYTLGDETEVLNYIGSFLAGWKFTAGAIAWLRANVKSEKKKAEVAPPKGPLGFIKKWLSNRLPQEVEVWQADVRQLPNWIKIGDVGLRLWVVLVTSRSYDFVLAHELLEEAPSSALVWDTLVKAMQYPLAGEPHRPTEVQVLPSDLWESLRPHVEEVGVTLETTEELDQLDEAFASMCEHVCGKPQPGLLDMPGITPERGASYYEAAAAYFEQAPWKKVGFEAAIKVECAKFTGGPWYAVLMGQSGLSMGLAVYEDLGTLKKMWAHEFGDEEENARQTVGMSVIFGEAWEISVADYEAAQRHGWKVARPEAYPWIFHKERGRTMRPPLAWELELMEGCLRAVPDFVARRQQEDPTPETLTVPVASGPLTLGLSWVPDAAAL